MRYLLDINIWLDIASRPKSFPDSAKVYRQLEEANQEICFPLCGYTTFHFILSRILKAEAAVEFIRLLKQRGVKFMRFSDEELTSAFGLNFSDHEDACIASTALINRCDFIVTRNTRDFKNSPIAAVSPNAAIRPLKQ